MTPSSFVHALCFHCGLRFSLIAVYFHPLAEDAFEAEMTDFLAKKLPPTTQAETGL